MCGSGCCWNGVLRVWVYCGLCGEVSFWTGVVRCHFELVWCGVILDWCGVVLFWTGVVWCYFGLVWCGVIVVLFVVGGGRVYDPIVVEQLIVGNRGKRFIAVEWNEVVFRGRSG